MVSLQSQLDLDEYKAKLQYINDYIQDIIYIWSIICEMKGD